MEDFRTVAHGVSHGRRADRHDHEFLDVDRIVGVGAAIDDVHHRARQHPRLHAAEVAIERLRRAVGRGFGDRERDAEDGVGAEASFVFGAVEFDHHRIDAALVFGVHAENGVGDLAVHGFDRVADAFAEIAVRLAVALFDGFVRAG